MKPNILIAVPAYGGSTENETVLSLVGLIAAIIKNDMNWTFKMLNRTGINVARNLFSSIVLQRPAITHLAMIDYDMDFKPEAFLRAIRADKPIVGIAAPRRGSEANKPSDFNVIFKPSHDPTADLAVVESVGAALMLIRRDALEQMRDSGKLRKQTVLPDSDLTAGYAPPLYGFFDDMTFSDGGFVQEDVAFCRRWSEFCGGSVYAILDEMIGHKGTRMSRGKLSAAINPSLSKQQSA